MNLNFAQLIIYYVYEPFVRDNFNEQEENIEIQAKKKSVFSNII